MEDFIPSQNYHSMWNDAKKLKNIDKLDELYHQLCFEIGYQDPARESIGVEAAKRAAESKNARDAGIGGKKV
jgi:hypothetical protein